MEELIAYIEQRQENAPLCVTLDTLDAENGYLTACEEIKAKIAELTANKASRWAIINNLFAIDLKADMREILKRRK